MQQLCGEGEGGGGGVGWEIIEGFIGENDNKREAGWM